MQGEKGERSYRTDDSGVTHAGHIVLPTKGRNAFEYYTRDSIWVALCSREEAATWLWKPDLDEVPTCLLCVVADADGED